METAPSHEFGLTMHGERPTTIRSRPAAVERAKRLSSERERVVRLERSDGAVVMEFSHGSLTKYHYVYTPVRRHG